MKSLFLFILLILFGSLAPAQGLEEGFYQGSFFGKRLQKVPSTQMGYQKSLYYRLNRNVILGGGTSLRAVRSMAEMGAQNVVIEARGTLHPQYPARVNFGPYGGGAGFGFTNLISAVHTSGMVVTLKLRLVEPDGVTSASDIAPDTEAFWDSYIRFAQRFAKIAQENSVAELVLVTGMTRQVCSGIGHVAIPKLLDSVRYYYTGRIRLDVESVDQLPALVKCIADQIHHFDSLGFEVPAGSDAKRLTRDFDLARRTMGASQIDIVALGVSFSGLDQPSKFEKFFKELRSLPALQKRNFTMGLVDVDPDRISPLDESAGILGKTTLEVIKSWFTEL